jgi:nitrogen fixation/metabolism regulation signal transduction histidine kinase
MIVACNKCGAKFQITPEHKKRGLTEFTCEFCKSIVTVPPEAEEDALSTPASASRRRGMGLREKMFFLFFVIPICLIIAASLFYLNYMKNLSSLITKESSQLVTKMAEAAIAEKSRSVAAEAKRYLEEHPTLKKENFMQDPVFKSIGMQKVGQTGYTVLVSTLTQTEPSALWLHPKKELIGKDIVAVMKKTLGDDYERWYKIQDIAFTTGRESGGYYKWFDKREKYMVMVPIEGTPFWISATTYIDEFTLPMTELEKRANTMTAHAESTVMLIFIITAVLIALFVIIYSYRLSGRINSLCAAADRISIGNLDIEVTGTESKDELGELANAFSRMQTSIRLAIKRMRGKM